jgi:hypothetical protein
VMLRFKHRLMLLSRHKVDFHIQFIPANKVK